MFLKDPVSLEFSCKNNPNEVNFKLSKNYSMHSILEKWTYKLGAREMTQWLKQMLCSHEDLSTYRANHIWSHAVPVTLLWQWAETAGALWLTAFLTEYKPTRAVGFHPGSRRDCGLKGKGRRGSDKGEHSCTAPPFHMCMWAYTHMHSW